MPTPAAAAAMTMATAKACLSINDHDSAAAAANAARPHAMPVMHASNATGGGTRQLCADTCRGPASTVKPPVIVTMTRTTSAALPTAAASVGATEERAA